MSHLQIVSLGTDLNVWGYLKLITIDPLKKEVLFDCIKICNLLYSALIVLHRYCGAYKLKVSHHRSTRGVLGSYDLIRCIEQS